MDVLATHRDAAASEQARIASFLDGFTVETTPASAAKVTDFRELLRPGTTVYITFLPGSDYNDTIAVAKRLRDEGFEPAPHIAARSLTGQDMLDDYVARVCGEAGVDHVLVIAGAVDQPVGPFSDSMQVLDTGVLDRHGVRRIGVAGHPEGSPDMSDQAIADALKWKNGFAERTDADVHILTQFCFEAPPIIAWDKRLNAEGNRLPIRIGLPGLAKVKTLLNYAIACGIGNSIQFIKKRAANVTKLLRTQAPDTLLRDLSAYAASDPACGIDGVHMYPLGGLAKTTAWSYAVVDGEFKLKGDGFNVNVDVG